MIDAVRIEDVLRDEGVFVSTTSGVSMYPMLRDRRDTIVVRPLKEGERLKKLDVPLYKRGEKYVLHRIIKVLPDGYNILGDNCANVEKNIPDSSVIGVLQEFWRGDKKISLGSFKYKLYKWTVYLTYPVKLAYKRLRAFAGKLYRKIRPK